ncbi:flavodoxin [Acidaminobacter sp. JC074]|uniref:flavodoxin family protein n=1 Tax=Acidaminobacter sp. JC074 TaxID=2530199 RepID=UPI001F0F494C|nr:flavodoxin family protein [Acidaminobacter sp. JC074]MCH4891044.1 flavodoxin [Acidaminobacter sp. JC074]
MKTLIVYSSRTGNTKKLAQRIYEDVEKHSAVTLSAVEDLNEEIKDYDYVAIGYWNDKGTADKLAQTLTEKIVDKKVILFGTQGADPKSDHGKKCIENVNKIFRSNQVVGHFLCQGKIDPELTKQFQSLPKDHPHAMDEARLKRHLEAAKHPDADDLNNLSKMIQDIYKEV